MKDFIELIKANAKNFPERIAVIDGDRKISYAEFLSLVNTISYHLNCISSKPLISFDLQQSIEAYALIVAVMNVRGVYCPLNPDAPIERKMQIINEFTPDLIVCETEETKTGLTTSKVIMINELLDVSNSFEKKIYYDGEDIIYIIYTSGTTGMPKGVMICRKSLNKFLEWSIPTYAANENDIWGQFSFLSFDLSIVDIFTCLCSGATLLVMSDKTSKWVPTHAIEMNKITIWHSIPSAVDLMIERDKSKSANFSSLRLMSFCGEPLRKHHMDFLFSKNLNLTIFNTYGPTEGTLFCTSQTFNNENYLEYCSPTMCIGKPIPGWEFTYNPSADTTEMEIVIYGDYIGKGYLGNTQDSKFRIIEIDQKRVYAFETGDLVVNKNGNLYFSCRKDRQIKLNGYRIEPDEIDYWITECTGKISVTILHGTALYSFIETEESINAKNISDFLKRKIESYKIPRSLIAVNKIPRSSNFKINYNELTKLI